MLSASKMGQNGACHKPVCLSSAFVFITESSGGGSGLVASRLRWRVTAVGQGGGEVGDLLLRFAQGGVGAQRGDHGGKQLARGQVGLAPEIIDIVVDDDAVF